MQTNKSSPKLVWTGIFAIAMAYLEAAVVVYLRRIFGIVDVYPEMPPFDYTLGLTEAGRELATLVMLFSLSLIAGKGLIARTGYFIYSFGLWDIFYYIWLRVLIAWPQSLLDWDLLFLLPLPWWGPVAAPVIIASGMVIFGVIFVRMDEQGLSLTLGWYGWLVLSAGLLLMLFAFMADALMSLPASAQDLHRLRPEKFRWIIFLAGLAMPVYVLTRSILKAYTKPSPPTDL